MVMLWELVRRGQAESCARLPTPTCSGTRHAPPGTRAVPTSLLTAKDTVTDGKSLAPRKFGHLQGSCMRDWGPATGDQERCSCPAIPDWCLGVEEEPLPCWTECLLLC